jgi:hypothetical protein
MRNSRSVSTKASTRADAIAGSNRIEHSPAARVQCAAQCAWPGEPGSARCSTRSTPGCCCSQPASWRAAASCAA